MTTLEQEVLPFIDLANPTLENALQGLPINTDLEHDFDLTVQHLASLRKNLEETIKEDKIGILNKLDERMVPLREIDILTMETLSLRRNGIFLEDYCATYLSSGDWDTVFSTGEYIWSIHRLSPVYNKNLELICIEARGKSNQEDNFKYNVGFVTKQELRMLIRDLFS